MLELERWARRYGLAITALLSGAIIFWTALRSSLGDWYISETHADIIYTGLRRFGEFPFFSFVFNGGSYFLQDPQTNLFSPALPLILLVGPSVGLRLMEGLWGVLGVYVFTIWMRRRVKTEAALLGAVASTLGLGVLWKVAFGNDMFLWHLGLPLLLWCVERVMKERTLQSAIAFGLALGLLLLGPTFHSFIYLFLPAVPLFVIIEWAFERPTARAFGKTLLLFCGASAMAALIASPKLVCWRQFPMQRLINDHGVLSFKDALRGLFDYSRSVHVTVPTTRVSELGALQSKKWGLEECSAALPQVASVFALLGAAVGLFSRARRSRAVFAFVLLALGLALCCSWPIWSEFRALSGGSFRVAPRYLALGAFGLAVLTALGADALFQRFRRAALPTTLVALVLMLGSAIKWTVDAGNAPASFARAVSPAAFNPWTRYREERAALDKLKTFTQLDSLDTQRRSILQGEGLSDGFLIVGDDFKLRRWGTKRQLPIVAQGADQAQVTVEHLRIKLTQVAPHARIAMRAVAPRYGMTIRTIPPNAHVEVKTQGNLLIIENHGRAPVVRVVIGANLPISALWFLASGLGLLSAIAALILLERRSTQARRLTPRNAAV
jgi:hypothetical protein